MNAAALARVTRARSVLVQDHPFFGVLALHLDIVEDASVETMATDGTRLFYAPEFVLRQTDRKLLGTVAHEAFHCALNHPARLGGRDLGEANIAADLAINPELIRMGFELWDGHLIDWQYANMSFEEIYAARQQAARKEKEQAAKPKPGEGEGAGEGEKGEEGPPQAGEGKPGDKGGQDPAPGAGGPANGQSGDAGQPGEGEAQGEGQGEGEGATKPGMGQVYGGGGIMRPGDGSEAAARECAEKWQVITRQAAATAAKQAGTMPGMLQTILGELNGPTTVDVRQALAPFIDSRVAVDYSFTRPNRRFLHTGMILPGTTIDGLEHLIFAVDTSGSMDKHQLDLAAAVIVEAAEAGKVNRLTVIFADTHVRHVQEFERGDDIAGELDARGGGGTRFDDTFRWIEANAPDATAIIYLTDMECRVWGEEPAAPVLWAVHGDSRRFDELAARAPFGEAVYVGRLE